MSDMTCLPIFKEWKPSQYLWFISTLVVLSMPMREVTINGSLKKYLAKGKIEDNEKLVVTGNLSCQYYTTDLGPPDNHS